MGKSFGQSAPTPARVVPPSSSANAVDPDLGWRGAGARVDSPSGGGGPGGFRSAAVLGQDAPDDTAHAWAPNSRPLVLSFDVADELQVPPGGGGTGPKGPNAPPVTQTVSGRVLLNQQSDVLDVNVTLDVVSDSKDSTLTSGAQTSFDIQSLHPTIPAFDFDAKQRVSAIKGKFEMKGTVTIGTAYADGAAATDTSAYGRGTTAQDKANGDTSLGFHESCHRADYLDYLSKNTLPVFAGKVGITVTEWNTAVSDFKAAFKKYFKDMESNSKTLTDEVGSPTLSQYEALKKAGKIP